MSRGRRWPRRLLGVLALLLLLELALQAAGPVVAGLSARGDGPPDGREALTVLCVGDSHTYGLHLPRLYAYPALLAARLSERYEAPVAVLNRGVPGQNSAQVEAALADDLDALEPDLVVVLVGINDTWNTSGEDAPLAWLGRLKLVRLVRVLTAGVTTARPFEITSDERGEFFVDRGQGPRPVNATAPGAGTRGGSALTTHTAGRLRAIVALCRDAGAVPVLMTYAEADGPFADVNAAARDVAASEDVPLADQATAFAGHFADLGYESLMFNDHHPNMAGYQFVAQGLEQCLVEAGLVPAQRRPEGLRGMDGLSGPSETPSVPARLEAGPAGLLSLSGPPSAPFQVLCSRRAAPGAGFEVAGHPIPLLEDDVLALVRLDPTFSGALSAAGTAEVTVSPVAFDTAGADGLSACLVLLAPPGPDGSPRLLAVSPAVDVRR